MFISGAAIFITWAVGQNMDLVRKDYYEHEILFQQRIDAQHRTDYLRAQIAVTYDARTGRLRVKLPETHAAVTGRIHVYRPSDASLDSDIPLALESAGAQDIDVRTWKAGLWKVQISWAANGQKYYHEEPILIRSTGD